MNLVFDLGGVVVRWDPDAIIAGVFSDPSSRSRVKADVLSHADWLELDRGTLALEDAIRRAAQRTGIAPAEIAQAARCGAAVAACPFPTRWTCSTG